MSRPSHRGFKVKKKKSNFNILKAKCLLILKKRGRSNNEIETKMNVANCDLKRSQKTLVWVRSFESLKVNRRLHSRVFGCSYESDHDLDPCRLLNYRTRRVKNVPVRSKRKLEVRNETVKGRVIKSEAN